METWYIFLIHSSADNTGYLYSLLIMNNLSLYCDYYIYMGIWTKEAFPDCIVVVF